jgi:eukaryotic-like serine/threonine-protein kinase
MDHLARGSMLGPYEIESTLGVGGMGRVYKARDTRLGRAVAIKTSNDRFTDRFAREARAISALNHPNICTLYDVGPDYLVMEHIEGPTLAERLLAGPLPVEEALAVGAQIAAALEAAHDKGIVHRDLKPANIKLDASGAVKVLDFGLAKMEPQGADTGIGNLTEVGAVLGTSGYMAPEQLRGAPVDARADIWTFGAVLYELLTGARCELGRVKSSAVDTVLASEPRWTQVPRNVQRLVRRCLMENPRDRLRDIGDARWLLEDELAARESAPPQPSRRAFTGALLGVAAGAAAVGAWGWLRPPPAATAQRMLFPVQLPEGARVYQEAVSGPSIALSPDGRQLVAAANNANGRQLYIRNIDELAAKPLDGTAGAASPFFSHDGNWIGFFSDGRLQRVPAAGGAAVDIAAAPGVPAGAVWGPDDRILFTCGWRSPIYAAPARGGATAVLVPLDVSAPERWMRRPDLLPGARAVVVDVSGRIVAVDLATGKRAAITEGTSARYLESGQLLVARGSTVFAAPFDVATLALTGPLAPLIEGVAAVAGGTAHYAVSSRTGTLAYVPGPGLHALVLIDMETGEERRVLDTKPRFHRPRFAPDGRRLAVAAAEPRGAGRGVDELWLYDLASGGAGSRITSEGASGPIWRDSATLVFAADTFWTGRPLASAGLYAKPLAGGEQRLALIPEFHRPVGFTPKGLLFELTTDAGEFRIELLPEGGERRLVALGINGRVSPDGTLLAFCAERAGRDAIFVKAIDAEGVNAEWIADGSDPVWGPDGRVHYWFGDRLWAAEVEPTSGARVRNPSPVLEQLAPFTGGDYDISPDGRTMALVRPVDATRGREIIVAFDWVR